MSRLSTMFALGGLIAVSKLAGGGLPSPGVSAHGNGVTVREEPARVLIRWKGAVDNGMADQLEAAFRRYRYDDRPVVLSLESGGGLVAAGQKVIEVIDDMKRLRVVHTLVESRRSCASMCVPIFLAGSRRVAEPKARFMFHEVKIVGGSPEYTTMMRRMQNLGFSGGEFQRLLAGSATDLFFKNYLNYNDINESWLDRMRESIRGGKDVWLTAEQIVDQGAGVVHAIE